MPENFVMDAIPSDDAMYPSPVRPKPWDFIRGAVLVVALAVLLATYVWDQRAYRGAFAAYDAVSGRVPELDGPVGTIDPALQVTPLADPSAIHLLIGREPDQTVMHANNWNRTEIYHWNAVRRYTVYVGYDGNPPILHVGEVTLNQPPAGVE